MDHQEFFQLYGALPVQFAAGVYITVPHPTVEELYQAFAARVFRELGEAQDDIDKVQANQDDPLHQLLGNIEERLKALETKKGKSKAAQEEKPETDSVKVSVELAAQDKLELVGSVLAEDQAAAEVAQQEGAPWEESTDEASSAETGADDSGEGKLAEALL